MFGLTDAVGRVTTRAASYAAVCLLVAFAGTTIARADTRSLKIYHLHTHEKEEIAYKRNGRYLPDGLKKINWILRDWRKQQPINMDPRLLDLIWEAYRQSGSSAYINVVCGYRSPATNGMLRSRTSGVAKESQHMLGKAMDFYLPDVSLAKLRAIGLKMQIGGVGFYPRSGSPFVHFDVGNVRHWPKMSRKELLAVFPSGNTLHVPSDGRPLPGYEQALASYKARKSDTSIQVANAGASSSKSSGGGKTLLAMLFGGGGADEEEDNADGAEAKAAPAKVVRPDVKEATKPAASDVVPARDVKPAKEATVAMAALAAAPRRELLPSGVPLPIRDKFDMSGPKDPVPPADLVNESPAESTQVAALDVARIPLPSFAPSRETTLVADAMKIPVPSQPAATPAKSKDETLLAALESSSAVEEIEAGTAGQLAYAVPTPHVRPPFESVLKSQVPTVESVDEIKRIVEQSAVAPKVAAAAPTKSAAATTVLAANHDAELARYRPQDRVLLASLESPKAPAPIAIAKPVVPAGKTARFARQTRDAALSAATAAPIDQQTIDQRIRMANLVTSTRSDDVGVLKAKAGRLARKATTATIPSDLPARSSDAATARALPVVQVED